MTRYELRTIEQNLRALRARFDEQEAFMTGREIALITCASALPVVAGLHRYLSDLARGVATRREALMDALLTAALTAAIVFAFVIVTTNIAGAEICSSRVDHSLDRRDGKTWRWRDVDGRKCWFRADRQLPREDLIWSYDSDAYDSDVRVIERRFYTPEELKND